MSDPLAQSMVEVIADTSKVPAKMVKDLETATDAAGKAASKVLQDQLDLGGTRAVESLGTLMDSGLATVGTSAAAALGATFEGQITTVGGVSANALADSMRTALLPEATALGAGAADALGTAFDAGASVAGAAGADAFRTGYLQIGDQLVLVTRDAAGKLRDERGRFVAAGLDAGQGLTEGLDKGSAPGLLAGREKFAAAGAADGKSFSDAFSKFADSGVVSAATGAAEKFGSVAKDAFLTASTGAAAATGALTLFGVKSAGNLQQTQVAFTQLTGSAQNAQKEIAALQSFAAATPFEFKDVSQAATKLLAVGDAAGITQQNLIPVLTTIGDVGSAFGASGQQINGAINALAQIAGAGKFDLGNLNQISDNLGGFPARAVLAQQAAAKWGVSTQEALNRISSGALPAQEGIQLLLQGMQKYPGAAGGMAKQSETLNGVLSTFADTARNSLSNAFTPAIPKITDSLNQLVPIMQSALDKLGPVISNTLVAILPLIGQAVDTFATLLQPIIPIIADIAPAISTAFKTLGPVMASLFTALAPLAGPLNNLIVLFTQLLVSVLTPLIPIVTQFVSQFVQSGLIDSFFGLAQAVAPLIAALGGAFIKALEAILPVLPPIVDGVTALVTAFGPVFQRVLAIIADIFVKFVPVLSQVAAIIISSLTPVLPTLANAFLQILDATAPLVPLLAGAFLSVIKAIAPVLPQLVDAFVQVSVALVPLVPLFTRLLEAVIPIAAALDRFLIINVLTPAIRLLADMMVIAAKVAADLARWFFDLLKYSRDLAEFVAGAFVAAWHGLQDAAQSVLRFFQALPGYFQAAMAQLGQLLEAGWQVVIEGARAVADFFAALPGIIINELIALPGQLLDLFIGGLKLLLQGIGEILGLIYVGFVELGRNIVFAVTELPGILANLFVTGLRLSLDAVVTGGKAILDFFIQFGKDVINELFALPGQLASLFTNAWNAGYSAVVAGGKVVVDFFAALPGRTIGAIDSLGGMLAGFLKGMWASSYAAVTTGIDTVVGWFKAIPGKIKDLGSDMLGAGESLIKSVFDGFARVPSIGDNIARSVVNGIIHAINWAIDQVNDGLSNISIAGIGFGKHTIPDIPDWKAYGGIFDRPSVIGVGEAGKEVVVPLTNPARATQLAQQSGLVDLLARQGVLGGGGPRQVINMTVQTPAANPAVVAAQVMGQLARRAA